MLWISGLSADGLFSVHFLETVTKCPSGV